MPKVILEFTLPEEIIEYHVAINGDKYISLIQELDNYMRNILKYEDAKNVKERIKHEAFQEIRDKLYQLAKENNVEIWK